MKSNNHYSVYCNLCLTNELNLSVNSSYYYDDIIDNGKIILIKERDFDNKINILIKNNPFIKIYIKQK